MNKHPIAYRTGTILLVVSISLILLTGCVGTTQINNSSGTILSTTSDTILSRSEEEVPPSDQQGQPN